jgi:transcriptional regulator with XRE-family HTH domain
MSRRKINTILIPGQCRAARALLGITQAELAEAAEAGTKTIADFERGTKRDLHTITLRALGNALEKSGIEFLDTEGGRPGVRLKKPLKTSPGQNRLITPELCRAAREFLYINQQQLADVSKVKKRTIADFERGMDRNFNESILKAIRASLEKAGIEFIESNGSGPGVRLKKKK